jgi:cytochrome b561
MSIDCLFGIDLTPRQEQQHHIQPKRIDIKEKIKQVYNLIGEKVKEVKSPEQQKRSHINCIHIISILLCVLCPVTGILGIYFSKKTKKYFEENDLEKAKKNLKKSEWLLIATIFCGAVFLIGLIFFLIVYFVI